MEPNLYRFKMGEILTRETWRNIEMRFCRGQLHRTAELFERIGLSSFAYINSSTYLLALLNDNQKHWRLAVQRCLPLLSEFRKRY